MEMLADLKILCVEDDEFALGEMINFLKKRVGKVFAACDGEEGIRQYEVHKPDVIVVDLLMPKMDGMEMLRRVKAINPNVHVIVVTSVKALDTVLESIDIGVDNYIVKPVEFHDLEKKLAKIAEKIHMKKSISSSLLRCVEDKRVLEDSIKKEFIKTLKGYMGKGPKEVIVQLSGHQIDIVAMDSLTAMEANMILDRKNHEIVRQSRNIAYEAICRKFSEYLSELLKMNVMYDKAEIDLRKKIDKIRFIVS